MAILNLHVDMMTCTISFQSDIMASVDFKMAAMIGIFDIKTDLNLHVGQMLPGDASDKFSVQSNKCCMKKFKMVILDIRTISFEQI